MTALDLGHVSENTSLIGATALRSAGQWEPLPQTAVGGAEALLGAVERRLRDIGAVSSLATFQRLCEEERAVLVRREQEYPIVEVR